MPKSIENISEMELKQVPLPTSHSKQYAVVSHGYIIDIVKQELENNNLEIDAEYYRSTHDGQVAQGIYHIKYDNDPELGLMFAWCNSYNKTMRFKCAVGAHVFVCGNGVMVGDMGNYTKKHYGDSAKVKGLVKNHIETQIASADNFYNMLQKDKEAMKLVCLSEEDIAGMMGCVFFKDIMTINQLSIAKKQYEKPDYDYNAERNSLWSVYNHITFALKTSHPKNWMDQQADLHKYVVKTYLQNSLTPPVVTELDPNQINIVDQIDEIEKEDSNDQLIDREITPSPLECSKPEGTEFDTPHDIPEDIMEQYDDQTRLEEGLDHKGEFPEHDPVSLRVRDDKIEQFDDETGEVVKNEALDNAANEEADMIEKEEIIEEREEEDLEESDLTFEDYLGSEDADLDPLHDTEAELNKESEEVIEEVDEDSDEGKLELPDFEF